MRYVQRALQIFAGLLLVICVVAAWQYFTFPAVTDNMDVWFVQTIEDADCCIIRSAGICTVIDTGETRDAERILEFLREQEIDAISNLILTHPDKDHVGGALSLWNELSIEDVYVPSYEKGDKELYQAFMKVVSESDTRIHTLENPVKLTCGAASLLLLPPEQTTYQQSNDYSVAVLVEHGKVKVFFAGDSEKKRIKELLHQNLPQVDLYKVAHHGRDSTAGVELIERLSPRYAVVTAEAPEGKIASALQHTGSAVFSTRDQTWHFISNGVVLQVEEN